MATIVSPMPDIAVSIVQVGKCYRLGEQESPPYHTLRDHLAEALTSPWRHLKRRLFPSRSRPSCDGKCSPNRTPSAKADTYLWALKDISLDIHVGDVVGIVGANGAGKSTLLKVLSRITEPTEGLIDLYGRVGSLLEVGTGFHQELTGRENVFLNGAILRMTRREIRRKFDDIVSFAEVDKFIDTPVKHYSSGMYLRLAFAVAAHMEPEILLVDEVLAVGDASFQKKCLGKMKDIARHGRTVVFVSHNLSAITRLCNRAILLDGGRLIGSGTPHDIVSAHLNTGLNASAAREWPDLTQAPPSAVVRLRAVRVLTDDRRVSGLLDIREPVQIEMDFDVLKEGCVLMPHFCLTNEAGVILFSAHDLDPTWRKRTRPRGRYKSRVRIPGNFLCDGMVFVSAGCASLNPVVQQEVFEPDVVAFRVVETVDDHTARGDFPGYMDGVVRPLLQWATDFEHATDGPRPQEVIPPTAKEVP